MPSIVVYTVAKQFLTLTSHCSISAMMTVDCPHSTHTTLWNVWLSTSTTVAKNWTTAFPKVGTRQRCGSYNQGNTNITQDCQKGQSCQVRTSCSKSTLPAHHQCLSLAPPTVTHSPPEPLHTDLHSALTLPLSTNKTKISRAALRLGGGVSLTDNTDHWRRIVAVWWWWQCSPWTLLQGTLISSTPHISGENWSIATSEEGSSQRNGPCMFNLKITHVLHHNHDLIMHAHRNKLANKLSQL